MDAPAVAVSADGKRSAVAWMDERAGKNQKDVWWRMGKDGRYGAPESALADDMKNIQAHPQLAIDETGVVHAVWEDGRAGATRIYYATSAKPGNVPVSDEGRCGFPSLAVTKTAIVIVYEAGEERVVCRTVAR